MPLRRAHFKELMALHKYDVQASLAVCEMTCEGNFDVYLKEDKKDIVLLPPSAGN